MNYCDDNILTEICSYLNARERVKMSLVNKYLFQVVSNDTFWEKLGTKLGLNEPKPNARKYKTWMSIIMRGSEKLCKVCMEDKCYYDTLCNDCFIQKRNSEGTPEIRALRFGSSVYLNQTEILSHYHLKKGDIAHLPCHYITTRYYDIYQYEQDKAAQICLDKYGGLAGFYTYLEEKENKTQMREINRQGKLNHLNQYFDDVCQNVEFFDTYKSDFLKGKLKKTKLKSMYALYNLFNTICNNLHFFDEYITAFVHGHLTEEELHNTKSRYGLILQALDENNISNEIYTQECRNFVNNPKSTIDTARKIANYLVEKKKRTQSFPQIELSLGLSIEHIKTRYIECKISLFDIILMKIRHIGLIKELEKKGLQFREDSTLCEKYIYYNNFMSLHDTIDKMEEISWFYNNTDYAKLYRLTGHYMYIDRYDRYDRYDNYDDESEDSDDGYYMEQMRIERSEETKKMAIKDWMKDKRITSIPIEIDQYLPTLVRQRIEKVVTSRLKNSKALSKTSSKKKNRKQKNRVK